MVVIAAPIVVLSGMQLMLPVLPVMQTALGLSDSEISLVSSAYLLPGVLMAIPAGIIGDRFGRRVIFGWSLILFGSGGTWLLMSHDFVTILVVRLFQGVAFAAILPLAITMIGELWATHGQLRNQGMRVIGMNAGNVGWPIIGGIVAASAWYAVFAFQILAIPIGVAALRLLPRDTPNRRAGPGSHRHGLFEVMRTRQALIVEGTAFLRFLLRFGFLTYGPILLVSRQNLSALSTGLLLGASALCATITAAVTGRLAGWVPPSRLMATSGVGMAVGLVLLAVGGYGSLAGPLIYGLADGVFAVTHSGFMTQAAPRSARATFVATTGAIKNVGKFLAPSLMVGLLLVMSLNVAFVALALLALMIAPMGWMLKQLDLDLAPKPTRLVVE